MSAKAYDKKTAAFAGFVIQNFPDGLTSEIMDGWMNNPAATKKFLADLVPPEAARVPDVFRLSVDYGQTLEQMIAAGQYDWKNDDITAKRFPIEGKGTEEFEARYFHFNRDISSEKAIKENEAADPKNLWSPAKIEHVLSHGKTFPEEQRKFPIIGLGSIAEVDGSRRVPVLRSVSSERALELHWFDDDWRRFYRFLAVRRVSAS